MPRINVDVIATEPLTSEEYAALLDAVTAPKLRALIQLMRWSGLAVRDAVTLERADIQDAGGFYRVVTARQKTGTHVSVPIPAPVARRDHDDGGALVNDTPPPELAWLRRYGPLKRKLMPALISWTLRLALDV